MTTGDDDLNVDQHQIEGQHSLQWMDTLIFFLCFGLESTQLACRVQPE